MAKDKHKKQQGQPAPHATEAQTAVVVVIDRSGSMEQLRGFVVEGANQLLAGLDATDRVTIVQFDGEDPYELIVDAVPAAEVTPLTYEQYRPRGSTPLFDAVGEAVTRTATWADLTRAATGIAPKVLLSIITDGYENASTRWSAAAVAEMVAKYQELGWIVTYTGLGIDATRDGHRLGVSARTTRSRGRGRVQTVQAFRTLSLDADLARGRAPRPREEDES
jgi:Mg-chelatase subunit ChlD